MGIKTRKTASRQQVQTVDFSRLCNAPTEALARAGQIGKNVYQVFQNLAGSLKWNVKWSVLNEVAYKGGKKIMRNPAHELERIESNIDGFIPFLPPGWGFYDVNPNMVISRIIGANHKRPTPVFREVVSTLRMLKVAKGKGERAVYARKYLAAFIQQTFHPLHSRKFVNLNIRRDFKINSPYFAVTKLLANRALSSVYGIKIDQLARDVKRYYGIDIKGVDTEAEIASVLNLSARGVEEFGKLPPELRQEILNILNKDHTYLVGLAVRELCERGFFSGQKKLVKELIKLTRVKVPEEISREITRAYAIRQGPRKLIFGHMLWLLAFPLSPIQGSNPICQSVRAISFIAQRDPSRLVKMLLQVLTEETLAIQSGKNRFVSPQGPQDMKPMVNQFYALDAVTFVLAPYLKDIYYQTREIYHKRYPKQDFNGIAQPAILGKEMVPAKFADLFGMSRAEFESLFYRNYHPEYRKGKPLPLPQPSGIRKRQGVIHDVKLVKHSISIQRVEKDPEGRWRVYYYDPSTIDVVPSSSSKISTWGNGERPGEASMLFNDFAKYINIFHYDRPSKE